MTFGVQSPLSIRYGEVEISTTFGRLMHTVRVTDFVDEISDLVRHARVESVDVPACAPGSSTSLPRLKTERVVKADLWISG